MVLKEAICSDNGEDAGILFYLSLFSVPFFLSEAGPMVRLSALGQWRLKDTDKPIKQLNPSSRFSTSRSKRIVT